MRGKDINRLFISPRNPGRQCSKNGISHFIKTLVKEAHNVLRPDLFPILKVKAHEVRAVSTSVLFAHTLSNNNNNKIRVFFVMSAYSFDEPKFTSARDKKK